MRSGAQLPKRSNAVYAAFRPVLWFSKLLATMPVRLTSSRQGAVRFVWSWLGAVYSALWVAAILVLKCCAAATRPRPPRPLPFEDDNGTWVAGNMSRPRPPAPSGNELFVGSVNDFMDTTCTVLIIILAVIGARGLPAIFNSLQMLDEEPDEDGCCRLDAGQLRRMRSRGRLVCIVSVVLCCVCTLTPALYSSTMALTQDFSWERAKEIAPFFFQDLAKLGNAAVEAQFLSLCVFLRMRFAALNAMLFELRRQVNSAAATVKTRAILRQWALARVDQAAPLKPITADVPDSLGRLCRWHRQLCDVVDALAACFQASLLVGIAFCFSNSVLGVYTFITKYKDRVPLAVKVPSAIWTACYSCRLVLFSTVPADTVAQARKTRVLVERLNNRSLDADSKQEIEIFISHLSSRHVTFTVCGFFTLDLLFLRSIAVAIVTYVILLMQFKVPNT
ncbi:putative gustatory receptor 28b [Periplaneta americana]|uniref:putative gustatory receptor 28b n=1 Tax=Periplaneta americana TaxID=6978 RepID=UPI0037E75A6D